METSSNFYPKAKISSRASRVPFATESARTMQPRTQTEKSADLESVLGFLRARIEAKQITNETYTSEAIAAYLIAEITGDDLSAGLSALDLYFSEFPKLKNTEWELILNAYRARYSRIDSLFQERIASTQLKSKPSRTSGWNGQHEIHTLLFVHLGIRVELSPFQITRVNLHEKTKSILKVLSSQPMEKSDFFTKVWGLKTFSLLKHDTVIRTALKRAREQAQIAIRSRDLRVQLDPSVLIIA